MKVLIGGQEAEDKQSFLDGLVDRWIVTDIEDLETSSDRTNMEVLMLFPKTSQEVTGLLRDVKESVRQSIPILVFTSGIDNIGETVPNVTHFPDDISVTSKQIVDAIRSTTLSEVEVDVDKVGIEISLHPQKNELVHTDGTVCFPQSEFDLLQKLLSNPGEVFSKDDLLAAMMSVTSSGVKIVDVLICKIRAKIKSVEWLEIETIRARGYAIRVSDNVILEWKKVHSIGDMKFDPIRWRLFARYQEITNLNLTVKEADVMEILLATPGKVYPKEVIFDKIYKNSDEIPQGKVAEDDKIIDIFICKIRNKLGVHRDCIETHWWRWYSFNQEAYERLLLAKKEFENAPRLTCSSPTWSDVEELFTWDYTEDWLMYVKSFPWEDEWQILARINYVAEVWSINVEVFDAQGFRSISLWETQELFSSMKIQQFTDFYEGVRGFMEVRNQDALQWENTWEHILKIFTRSFYWEDKIFRGYCQEIDKTIEIMWLGKEVVMYVCDKDYYWAFEKISSREAAEMFSGKTLKRCPSVSTQSSSKKKVVTVLNSDGMETQVKPRWSRRFSQQLRETNSLLEQYDIFTKNTTPNLKVFFKVDSGNKKETLDRVSQYIICFMRVGSSDEIRVKLYDAAFKSLYVIDIEELEELLQWAKTILFNVQKNTKDIFQQQGKPFSENTWKNDANLSSSQLQEFSLESLRSKVDELSESRTTGILLTVFATKADETTPITITVMSFGRGLEFRIDGIDEAGSVSNMDDIEKICSENGYDNFQLKG